MKYHLKFISWVFKIRSETSQTEAQFCQNLYMTKKESLPDWPKFCQSGSAVRHLFWRLKVFIHENAFEKIVSETAAILALWSTIFTSCIHQSTFCNSMHDHHDGLALHCHQGSCHHHNDIGQAVCLTGVPNITIQDHINGLVQDCSISIANVLEKVEILLSSTNPSIYSCSRFTDNNV